MFPSTTRRTPSFSCLLVLWIWPLITSRWNGSAFTLQPAGSRFPTTSSSRARQRTIPSAVFLTEKDAAALTETEASGPSSSVASEETKESSPTSTPPPQVQRRYETWLWRHELEEYNINYRVEGPMDGPPVLLIHGFGANVNHFRHQFVALPQAGFRTYAVDLLGFGASDKPPDAAYSIELFVQLLCDFVHTMRHEAGIADHRQQPSWFIAGNSIGGLCSLAVAEQLPDQVRGVVLFNCAGGMTGFRYADVPWAVRPILYLVQHVLLGPSLGGRFFANFKTRQNVESILRQQGVYCDQTQVDDELLEILLGPADDAGAEQVFLKTFAGPPGPTPESILPAVQCPILALWGADDPWTPVDKGMHPGIHFAQYTSVDFTLQVLPGVGHCPHDECPEQVHAQMIPWMKELTENPQAKQPEPENRY